MRVDRYLRRSEKRFKKCTEKKIQCQEMLFSEHAVSKVGETFEVRKDARKFFPKYNKLQLKGEEIKNENFEFFPHWCFQSRNMVHAQRIQILKSKILNRELNQNVLVSHEKMNTSVSKCIFYSY